MTALAPLPPSTKPAPEPSADDAVMPGPIRHQDEQPQGVHGIPEEPASLGNRLVMLLAAVAPLIGLGIGIVLLWQNGFMGWLYLSLLIAGSVLTELGITVAYHRLLSHRSYEAAAPARFLFVALGAMAVEGGPLHWSAVHRRHHQYSDQPGDPHSPHLHDGGWTGWFSGLWHSHIGWLFTQLWADPKEERYVPDLQRDPICAFVEKHYYLFVIASLGIPAAIAGLVTMSWAGAGLGLVWGGLVRIFLSHHITWSINSICHTFGSRDYETTDHSMNNAVCAILGVGEGWHNNHHAFPNSAKFGLRWYQFDLGWVVISTLKAIGLAWNVKVPSKAACAERRRI